MVSIDKGIVVQLWAAKEAELKRRITVKEVADATGINLQALTTLRAGRSTLFDARVLDEICRFFGVKAGPVPFLLYQPSETRMPRRRTSKRAETPAPSTTTPTRGKGART